VVESLVITFLQIYCRVGAFLQEISRSMYSVKLWAGYSSTFLTYSKLNGLIGLVFNAPRCIVSYGIMISLDSDCCYTSYTAMTVRQMSRRHIMRTLSCRLNLASVCEQHSENLSLRFQDLLLGKYFGFTFRWSSLILKPFDA